MNNNDLQILISKIEKFNFEDFINMESGNEYSSEFERGFNLGIGLCLSTLEDEKK